MKVILLRFCGSTLLVLLTVFTVNSKDLNPTPPISHGEYSSGVLAPGHVITFDGSGSYDTDIDSYGVTPKWRWDFDYDGSFDPGSWTATPQTTHIFSSSRTYTIAVQYMDNEGQTGMPDIFQVTITQKRRYYYIKDHLGSIRTTVDEDGYVAGYDDYYPFGLTMPGRSSNTGNPNDDVKFTGYELDDEGNLTLYHAGNRMYDPVLGRFMQIDRFHHKYPSLSTYQYAANNPLYFIDINGDSLILNGKQENIDKFVEIVNAKLNGKYIISVNSEGLVSVEGEGGNLTKSQQAFYTGLMKAASHDVGVVNIEFGDAPLYGSYATGKIDMDDIQAVTNGEYYTKEGALIHEIVEQSHKQLNGSDFETAHSFANDAMNSVNGSKRIDNDLTTRLGVFKTVFATNKLGLHFSYQQPYLKGNKLRIVSVIYNEKDKVLRVEQ